MKDDIGVRILLEVFWKLIDIQPLVDAFLIWF